MRKYYATIELRKNEPNEVVYYGGFDLNNAHIAFRNVMYYKDVYTSGIEIREYELEDRYDLDTANGVNKALKDYKKYKVIKEEKYV